MDVEEKTRKDLVRQYNERKIVGGVYAVRNTRDGTVFLDASGDIRASVNRFDFSRKMGVCPIAKIKKDWDKLGPESFVFEILEEHVKDASRTDREFLDDLGALKALWGERLSGNGSVFY
jgi:hypothetical protein